ncbi:MAG TPA: hypothetical protein VNY51_00715 [Candidatus Dormibacteraeota bacterium]|jgi:hypothetical protein|nr:hypothetical protein [Candidatus Dormibacteraeota bacterium]
MPLDAIRPGERPDGTNPLYTYSLALGGQTLESLYRTGTQQEIEEVLGAWLRATIQRLEVNSPKEASK